MFEVQKRERRMIKMKKSMKKICVFLAVLLAVVALPVSAQADGRKNRPFRPRV